MRDKWRKSSSATVARDWVPVLGRAPGVSYCGRESGAEAGGWA